MQLLSTFFSEVYLPRRLAGRSDSTPRQYCRLIRYLGDFLQREPRTGDLNEDTLVSFLGWLADRSPWRFSVRKRQPRTINKYADQLTALSNLAVKKRVLDEVPDLPRRPEVRRVAQVYTVDQVGALLCACREFAGTYARLPAGLWWQAFVLVLYDTGLRPGVVWALRRADLDWQALSILAPGEHQKQRADQLLRISSQTCSAINAIWLPERDLLFPYDCRKETLYNHYYHILRNAGLPCERNRANAFKRLRKTCATLGKLNGCDPTAQLGHSSDAVTRRHYLAPLGPQAADVLPRPTLSDESPDWVI